MTIEIKDNLDIQGQLTNALDLSFYRRILKYCDNHISEDNEKSVVKRILPESGILEAFNNYVSNLIPLISSGLLKENILIINEEITTQIEEYISLKYPFFNIISDGLIRDYVQNIQIILSRYNKDKDEIHACFHIVDGCIAHIRLGCGDFHRGRQSVAEVFFVSGESIFYKPRGLKIDDQFYKYILNASESIRYALKVPHILNREDYGWEEKIKHTPCKSEGEVKLFYLRLGALLSFIYTMGATDIHYENIIASGEYPVLVDLESLFCPEIFLSDDLVNQSVLRTGMIQLRFNANEIDPSSLDISGLSNTNEVSSPIPIKEYILSNEGSIQVKNVYKNIKAGRNMPKLCGKVIPPAKYIAEICIGFEKGYRYVMLHKEETELWITQLSKEKIRILIRPTLAYSFLKNESKKLRFLKDGDSLSQFYSKILLESNKEYPKFNKLVEYEVESLMRGDVPYFFTKVNSSSLECGDGKIVFKNFLEMPGLVVVKKLINNLCEKDLAVQKWIIKTALQMPSIVKRNQIIPKKAKYNFSGSINNSLTSIIEDVYRFIVENVNVTNDIAHWMIIHPTNLEGNQYKICEASWDLFYGMPGEILFLSYYYKIYKKDNAKILAKKAYKYLDGQVTKYSTNFSQLGLYNGWGSFIFLNTTLYEIYGEQFYLDRNRQLLRDIQFDIMILSDSLYSLINGSAGFVVALCDYYNKSQDYEALRLSKKASDHLLKNSVVCSCGIGWKGESRVPLSGMSHGASGIALAFLRMFQVTKEKQYAKIIDDILSYEQTLYSEQQNNWLDLRDYVTDRQGNNFCSTAWSHGAGGIGLFRAELIKAGIESDLIKNELRKSVETVIQRGFTTDYDLSYGSFGNIELLLEYIKIYPANKTITTSTYNDILNMLISNYQSCNYTLGMGHKTLGLMTGYTGIGYECLKILFPQEIRSVLTI